MKITYRIIQFPVDSKGTVWKSELLEADKAHEVVQCVIAGYAQGQTRIAILDSSCDLGSKGTILHAIGAKGERLVFPSSIIIVA